MASLYIYLFVLTTCFGVSIFLRNILTQQFKYLLFLISITWIVEITGTSYLMNFKKPLSILFHIFQPIEYLLLALFFYKIFLNNFIKKSILLSIPIVIIVSIINSFFLQNIYQFNSYAFLFIAFLLVIWSILYFIELLNNEFSLYVWNNPNFWICTGILFFYAGSFFLMGFITIIYKYNPELASKIYIINHLLNIILYSLYTYGFICQNRIQQSSQL